MAWTSASCRSTSCALPSASSRRRASCSPSRSPRTSPTVGSAPVAKTSDDALSHVDTHTEEEILRRLRDFMNGRTTFLIAHRTSTVTAADSIVVLAGGSIVETGTHDELLAAGGAYARFFRRQLLEQELEE